MKPEINSERTLKAHLGSTLESGWPMLQGIVLYIIYET